MKTYVLTNDDEGEVVIFVANHLSVLKQEIERAYNEESEESKFDGDKEFIESQKIALVKMINNQFDIRNGLHLLKNIEPLWNRWVLFVCDESGGILG